MSPHEDDLPFGLYERLITERLKARLLKFDSAQIDKTPVDPTELASTLGRHMQSVVTRALAGLSGEERPAKAAAIANELIRLLAESTNDVTQRDESVGLPPTELRQVAAVGDVALADPLAARPLVPLSASDLMVNARGEPALASALAREIPSADSIELLCAESLRVG